MMAKMAIEGSTTGSISAGSVHDMNTDTILITGIPCTPINARKRKRRSFPESPDQAPTDETKAEIEKLLNLVPKIDEMFKITNKIGEGTFSSVYLADIKCCGPEVKQKFALKHITPTSHPDRTMGELQCLHNIGGVDNVMGMKLSLRQKDHVIIVMPYFPHDSFHVFVRKMTVTEMRDYMRNLLLALRRVHQFNVIHRDIKPSNFLCNRRQQKYALVDFGLAQIIPSCSNKLRLNSLPLTHTKLTPASESKSHTAQSVPAKQTSSKENHTKGTHRHSLSTGRLTELDLNTFNRRLPPQTPKGIPFTKTLCPPASFKKKMVQAKQSMQSATKHVQQHQRTARLNSGQQITKTCACFGQLQVCRVCTSRSGQAAPRAGTPGFRSPEVLLKCPKQTTAVDMWAAGVILLSILSGRYPFFKAEDDMTALAQIMNIMGTEEMKKAAREYGKEISCSVKLPAMDLMKMCVQLRTGKHHAPGPSTKRRRLDGMHDNTETRQKNTRRKSSSDGTPDTSPLCTGRKRRASRSPPSRGSGVEDCIPESAYDLLGRLLDLNPITRISAEDALKHPYIIQD